MVLLTSEENTVDQKCAIARDLLEEFIKIPVVYLRAISSPLVSPTLIAVLTLATPFGWYWVNSGVADRGAAV